MVALIGRGLTSNMYNYCGVSGTSTPRETERSQLGRNCRHTRYKNDIERATHNGFLFTLAPQLGFLRHRS